MGQKSIKMLTIKQIESLSLASKLLCKRTCTMLNFILKKIMIIEKIKSANNGKKYFEFFMGFKL